MGKNKLEKTSIGGGEKPYLPKEKSRLSTGEKSAYLSYKILAGKVLPVIFVAKTKEGRI